MELIKNLTKLLTEASNENDKLKEENKMLEFKLFERDIEKLSQELMKTKSETKYTDADLVEN